MPNRFVGRAALLVALGSGCGGSVDAGSGDASTLAPDASGNASDAGAPDASTAGDDASIAPDDSGPVADAGVPACSPTEEGACGPLFASCPQPFQRASGLCIGQDTTLMSTAPCQGFDLVVLDQGGGARKVLYYDAVGGGMLVGVVMWSGNVPGGPAITCTLGGASFPAPEQCMLVRGPTGFHDAGACPPGIPVPGSACAPEGLMCAGGHAPACECVRAQWGCSDAPP